MSEQPAGIIPEFTVADRLRKAREVTGLDQREFADEVGISRTTVSNYENGNTRPGKLQVRAWAMRSGVPVDWIMTGHVKAPDPEGQGPGLPRLDSNQQPSGYANQQVSGLHEADVIGFPLRRVDVEPAA